MSLLEALYELVPGAHQVTPTIGPDGDIEIVNVAEPRTDAIVLVRIEGPYARCVRKGLDILGLLDQDPAAGDAALNAVFDEIRRDIATALAADVEGIAYIIEGATPDAMSPMSYGGHFLERDRELLASIAESAYVLVAIVGGEGTFLDFVSDLPAAAFAWDVGSTGVTVADMRELRSGILAALDVDADLLILPYADLLKGLETQTIGTH